MMGKQNENPTAFFSSNDDDDDDIRFTPMVRWLVHAVCVLILLVN